MEHQILIREAVTPEDMERFWEQLHEYHKRDIFPESDSEELEYFLGKEYYEQMMFVHSRRQDKCYFLFFNQNGQDIGFAMPVIYDSEDGKCFILDYWVFPEFRGNGTGRRCFGALENHTKAQGAVYYEINCSRENARRFWKSLGFEDCGMDEYDMPMMERR